MIKKKRKISVLTNSRALKYFLGFILIKYKNDFISSVRNSSRLRPVRETRVRCHKYEAGSDAEIDREG